jgi:hypothetical protein
MMPEAAAAPRRPFLACAACVALVVAGCTMCPDPLDYAGPVPNGSAPQNDFLARSNGILPTGVAPKPFPPLVRAEPAGEESPPEVPKLAEEPAATEPKIATAEDEVLRLSAEEAVAETAEEADEQPGSPEAIAVPSAAAAEAATQEPEPAADPRPETDDWRARGAGEPAGSAAEPEPTQRETPGWRARR